MTSKLGIQHRVLKYYQICSNEDTGLTLTIFMTWSDLFPNTWVKRIVRIVMYFQACFNSAYPMHSSERCGTTGPLDWLIVYMYPSLDVSDQTNLLLLIHTRNL